MFFSKYTSPIFSEVIRKNFKLTMMVNLKELKTKFLRSSYLTHDTSFTYVDRLVLDGCVRKQ